MKTTVVGGYPKVLLDQKLRKAYHALDEGKMSASDLAAVQDDVTTAAMREMDEAGLDVVNDGLIRWDDEITHIAGKLHGMKIGGLIRFFDTNTFYRRPKAAAAVEWAEPIIAGDFMFATGATAKPVKAVVTGAYTIAKASDYEGVYASFGHLALDVAAALNDEAKSLVAAGAKYIHINDPFILLEPADFPVFAECVHVMLDGIDAHTSLYTYFGDATPLYDKMLALPVDALGFDFTYSPGVIDRLSDGSCTKELGAGIFDARNTKPEDEKAVLATLTKLAKAVGGDRIWVSPTASLEYLPLGKCRDKLREMVRIVGAFQGVQK